MIEKFFARPAHNTRNGDYFSLRIITSTSRLPGDRSFEFARLRKERDGWNARADDESLDRRLKATCAREGRNAPLNVVLEAIKQTYLGFIEDEFELKANAA